LTLTAGGLKQFAEFFGFQLVAVISNIFGLEMVLFTDWTAMMSSFGVSRDFFHGVPGDSLELFPPCPQRSHETIDLPSTVEISGQSEETGSSQAVVEASIEGPPILMAFNVRFLREALSAIPTPNVILETTVETSPGMLKPVGDTDFTHILMPMHLGG
jgi:hypothetical protein